MTEQIFPSVRNTSVLLNGKKLPSVTGVETFEYTEYYEGRELMSENCDSIPLFDKYTVKLCMAEEFSFPKKGFTLAVKTPHLLRTYKECVLRTVTERLKAPNIHETVYEIDAAKKDRVEMTEV
ncbi:MAG: hypothetical protein Q4D44_02665 [Eubacteriales bacterium]|nr:hypothetical protein [Eubacteriales bacterium]